jgi:hypothetical protein
MARGDTRSKGSTSSSGSAPEMDIYTGLSVVAFVAMLTALLLLIFWGLIPYKIL